MHNREKLVKKCSLRDSVNFAMENLAISNCPGFDQDKVNFHWNPRRDTAGQADPTWPNRAGYSIPCAIMLGSGVGELGRGNSLTGWERGWRSGRASLWVVRFVLCILLICVVVVTVPSVFCSVKIPLY